MANDDANEVKSADSMISLVLSVDPPSVITISAGLRVWLSTSSSSRRIEFSSFSAGMTTLISNAFAEGLSECNTDSRC